MGAGLRGECGKLKLVFRVDASSKIATGHLMRCLTLADSALSAGHNVWFVMRDPDEKIRNLLTKRNIDLISLNTKNPNFIPSESPTAYSSWLPVSQEQDALEFKSKVSCIQPDWVVVDHYAISSCWHELIKPITTKVMVIDDLANRNLLCDMLLDQNFGASSSDYETRLVSRNTTCLLGSEFALLRKEFRIWREFSKHRRLEGQEIKRVLITLGGADLENTTLQVLTALEHAKTSSDLVFDVILGPAYPYERKIRQFTKNSYLNINVYVQPENVAQIMTFSDICIGAGGSTILERCCLGLPALLLIIAENQINIAERISENNISQVSDIRKIAYDLDDLVLFGRERLSDYVLNSIRVCDGKGADKVISRMEHRDEHYNS